MRSRACSATWPGFGVSREHVIVWLLRVLAEPSSISPGEVPIIAQWLEEAERFFTDARDRADLGTLTLTFAALAQSGLVWRRGLRGWNMKTSPFLDEIRAEGRVEGRVEGVRATMLRLGREKF